MNKIFLRFSCLLLALLSNGTARAQVSNLPKDMQDWLGEVGPLWHKSSADPSKVIEVFTPLLEGAPKTGVQVTRDLAYGPDAQQKLDVYRPDGKSSVPIVVFFHGGAFVSGARNENSEMFSNVSTYFARGGFLGVNADYRLAPAVQWPAQSEDVGLVVKWLKDNAGRFGGDPTRIYLIGHSAGATDVATYAFHKLLQSGSGAVYLA
jgi:acetyl esterase/lipase